MRSDVFSKQRRNIISGAAALAGTATFNLPAALAQSGTLTDLTAVQAVTAMRRGDIKAEAYARALLARASALSNLNAFRALDAEIVLSAARAADEARAAGKPLGLLHGLPIPVKDSINTQALPTTNGTAALRDWRSREDAPLLQALFGQGALLMGKTNLHELSYGWTSNNGSYGAVRNPYDLERVPGGSSGGSGAAVAARMAPLAIGEDTMGSIRVPAALCGLAGLRPSFGRYPNAGVMPLTVDQFDQVGPMARTVADLALFDDAVAGSRTSLTAKSLRGARIGVSPEYFLSGLDPEVESITQKALVKLKDAGATLVWAEIPETARMATGIAATIIIYETMAAISGFLAEYQTGISWEQLYEQVDPGVQGVLKGFAMPPNRPSDEVYRSMLTKRAELQAEMRRYYGQQNIEALAFPPVMVPAPRIGEDAEVEIRGEKVAVFTVMARNTALGSAASLASLILPAGMTTSGLPVGLEFAAPSGNDRAVLALGLSLEKALGAIPAPRL